MTGPTRNWTKLWKMSTVVVEDGLNTKQIHGDVAMNI